MRGDAWSSYEQLTGNGLPDGDYTVSYPELGHSWDLDDRTSVAGRLPRLAAL